MAAVYVAALQKSPFATHHAHEREQRLPRGRRDPITRGVHDHSDEAACAHAEHQHARGPEALARAEAACRAKGVRLTPIRRAVLEALYATHRPLGAYDVAEVLATPGARRLAPITIYRALEFLIEQGLVHRLASRNAFVACPHEHGSRDLVAFLICDACGGVDELSSTGLRTAVSHLLDNQSFEPHVQVLEISGRCAHCRAPELADGGAPRVAGVEGRS
jgi:Fur family zinc uptake transcriptional regulator